jgi:hypothetical protein
MHGFEVALDIPLRCAEYFAIVLVGNLDARMRDDLWWDGEPTLAKGCSNNRIPSTLSLFAMMGEDRKDANPNGPTRIFPR